MIYLLDTNAFSELVRASPKVQAKFASLPPSDRVVICPILRGEVLHGLRRLAPGRRRTTLETAASALFAIVACPPMEGDVAERYARVKIECEKKGTVVDTNDLWIAATALTWGATLVTHDSDLARVPSLMREDWQ